MKKLQSFGLIVRPHHPPAARLARRIRRFASMELKKDGKPLAITPIILPPTDNSDQLPANAQWKKQCDMVLVLGGDGTMMRACRYLGPLGIPLIGINYGRLGFLTDLSDVNINAHLKDLCQGHYILEKRYMLDAQLFYPPALKRNSKKTLTKPTRSSISLMAINDIYLSKIDSHSVLEVNIYVDHDFVHCLRADGVIVAMPTGSTAYALSSGGPIIHPQAQGLLLVSVSPHTLTSRPIVLPEKCTITLKLSEGSAGWLFADGHHRSPIDDQSTIKIRRSKKSFTLAHPIDYNYYHNLRDKLYWHESPKHRQTS